MVYQTSVQNSNTIRFGSGKVEVGPDIDNLVNLGAMRDVKFTDEFDVVEIETDNTAPITVGVKNHTATIEGDMIEIDLANLNVIRGGIDTLTDVAGTPVSVTDEAHTLNDTDSVRLDHKNGDGSEVSTIVVTDASSNAAVRNTDYVIAVDSEGYTTIARVSGSTVIDDGEGILVSYDYTPNTAKKLTSGGKVTISDRVARITNVDENGKIFRITVYKAKSQQGLELEFAGDDEDDVATYSLALKGVLDSSRTAGDQLFEIYDEQGVSS
jgi:hypothetical protein